MKEIGAMAWPPARAALERLAKERRSGPELVEDLLASVPEVPDDAGASGRALPSRREPPRLAAPPRPTLVRAWGAAHGSARRAPPGSRRGRRIGSLGALQTVDAIDLDVVAASARSSSAIPRSAREISDRFVAALRTREARARALAKEISSA